MQKPPHAVSGAGHWQRPARHGVPEGQRLPHAPQLFASDCVSTQSAPHSVRGAMHIGGAVHTPATQLEPAMQRLPHIPQLAVSDWVSTHEPLQS